MRVALRVVFVKVVEDVRSDNEDEEEEEEVEKVKDKKKELANGIAYTSGTDQKIKLSAPDVHLNGRAMNGSAARFRENGSANHVL